MVVFQGSRDMEIAMMVLTLEIPAEDGSATEAGHASTNSGQEQPVAALHTTAVVQVSKCHNLSGCFSSLQPRQLDQDCAFQLAVQSSLLTGATI